MYLLAHLESKSVFCERSFADQRPWVSAKAYALTPGGWPQGAIAWPKTMSGYRMPSLDRSPETSVEIAGLRDLDLDQHEPAFSMAVDFAARSQLVRPGSASYPVFVHRAA